MSVEPWLRGPLAGLHPSIAGPVYTFQQTREELAEVTDGLTDEQVYARFYGLPSLAFHLRHIAGSTERLTTYIQGGLLSSEQVAQMKGEEAADGPSLAELLGHIDAVFRECEAAFRG